MIGLDYTGKRAIVFRPDCEMWSCAECAAKLRTIWTARVAYGSEKLITEGNTLVFCTVTSHEKLKTFAACYAVFPSAWSKLYAYLKRRTPLMAYALIPEKHQDGRMHIHILTTCSITKRLLKDNARSRGFGYQADVQPVEGVGHAAAYCSKYLGKGLGNEALPPHFRRIRLSQNFPENPDFERQGALYQWLCCRTEAAILSACLECQEQHISMVDLETGEMFDYNDLSERIAADADDICLTKHMF